MDTKKQDKTKLGKEWQLIRDRFKMTDLLGSGTFGQVVKVKERATGKTFAIKHIR